MSFFKGKGKKAETETPDIDTDDSNALEEFHSIEQMISMSARYQSENQLLRNIVYIVLIMMMGVFFGAYKIAMFHLQKPVDETFFAITEDGRLTSIQSENDKYSEAMLLQFAKEAGIESFSFDFVQANNQERLQDIIRKYYSRSGFQEYQKALEEGQYLRQLYANKEIARATSIRQPHIKEIKQVAGREYFVIGQSINVDFIGASNTALRTQTITIDMAITRLPVYEAVRGIGIVQIQARFD